MIWQDLFVSDLTSEIQCIILFPIWEHSSTHIFGNNSGHHFFMTVLGITLLDEFSTKHADVRSQVTNWLAEVKSATWSTPADIKARFATASFLANNCVIFNLKGNKYRLEVIVSFKNKTVLVKRIGTHAEYSKW